MRTARTAQWATLFNWNEPSTLPLHARLRESMVEAILSGRLDEGAPVPTSRELAGLLHISRNTVMAAYAQLVDEGYLETRQRSGVFVKANARPRSASAQPRTEAPAANAPDWAVRVQHPLGVAPSLAKPEQWRNVRYPFVYGEYDPELFPAEDFRECCTQSLTRAQLPHWTPDLDAGDVPELIKQIGQRVLPKRGVFAQREEILITVGAQQAFFLLAEALFSAKTKLGFEEPGYPHARNCFSLRSPQFVPAYLDAAGVGVAELPDIDYLYVTPSSQSPTTVTMDLQRRHDLLRAAEQKNFVVIEDDYEAENLTEGEPMPALKSLDRNGRVIYVGSLSKSLAPALRLGYIVAPKPLIDALRALRHAMVRHPSAFVQHAYALFASLGHHDSHARRVNVAMRERIATAAQSLTTHLPTFTFDVPRTGASIWVRGPAWLDTKVLARHAAEREVLFESGEAFFMQPPQPCSDFRLRLSSISLAQIDNGVKALRDAVEATARELGVKI